MKVNEIFHSLQGEGYYTGTAAAFLRLSGCNMQCGFCDTHHEEFRTLSVEEILEEINRRPVHHVVITGGEPTLQLSATLLDALRSAGYYIQIETNGSIPLAPEILDKIDWVTCSPKSDAPPSIGRIDELKVVFDPSNPQMTETAEALADKLCTASGRTPSLFLQPCDHGEPGRNRQTIRSCIAYILSHPRWRLSLQTHKLTGIR